MIGTVIKDVIASHGTDHTREEEHHDSTESLAPDTRL